MFNVIRSLTHVIRDGFLSLQTIHKYKTYFLEHQQEKKNERTSIPCLQIFEWEVRSQQHVERGHLLPTLPLDVSVGGLFLLASVILITFGIMGDWFTQLLGFSFLKQLMRGVDRHGRVVGEHALNYVVVVGESGLETQIITLLEIQILWCNIIHSFHFREMRSFLGEYDLWLGQQNQDPLHLYVIWY